MTKTFGFNFMIVYNFTLKQRESNLFRVLPPITFLLKFLIGKISDRFIKETWW